jgi:hypothetical protein
MYFELHYSNFKWSNVNRCWIVTKLFSKIRILLFHSTWLSIFWKKLIEADAHMIGKNLTPLISIMVFSHFWAPYAQLSFHDFENFLFVKYSVHKLTQNMQFSSLIWQIRKKIHCYKVGYRKCSRSIFWFFVNLDDEIPLQLEISLTKSKKHSLDTLWKKQDWIKPHVIMHN